MLLFVLLCWSLVTDVGHKQQNGNHFFPQDIHCMPLQLLQIKLGSLLYLDSTSSNVLPGGCSEKTFNECLAVGGIFPSAAGVRSRFLISKHIGKLVGKGIRFQYLFCGIPLPKVAKPAWARRLTQLPCFVAYVTFQFCIYWVSFNSACVKRMSCWIIEIPY